MNNKINQLFEQRKDQKLLSLYFCAGCPTLEATGEVIKTMQRRGIAMIEVGIPFSDPLADGPVIQSAATQALKNGMNLRTLFAQLKAIKDEVEIPLVLMGYLNPILHYGIEAFCQSCADSGISGMIIPDLPFKDYLDVVKPVADKYDLPQVIRNFISTHHGQGKAKFFYIRYKNEHPDEPVDDLLFTYPGPNPFTREHACLMMADSVEAASRSLKEYTEQNIRELVERIIDGQVADGYFRECPITFRDIQYAKTLLIEKLKTIYHTRISYPTSNKE